MVNIKDVVGATLLGVAATFVGFCLYFDSKRRVNPYLDKRIVEATCFLERENERMSAAAAAAAAAGNDSATVTELDASKENQFLHEIHLGEAKIVCGDIDNGIQNLAKAVFICDRPVRLLQAMQSVLDEEVFAKLMILVEEIRQRNLNLPDELDLINKEVLYVDVATPDALEKLSYNMNDRQYNCFGE